MKNHEHAEALVHATFAEHYAAAGEMRDGDTLNDLVPHRLPAATRVRWPNTPVFPPGWRPASRAAALVSIVVILHDRIRVGSDVTLEQAREWWRVWRDEDLKRARQYTSNHNHLDAGASIASARRFSAALECLHAHPKVWADVIHLLADRDDADLDVRLRALLNSQHPGWADISIGSDEQPDRRCWTGRPFPPTLETP